MSSNISENKNKTIRQDGHKSSNSKNSGHSTIKHSAVSNPVPGKGGKKNK